MALQTRHDLFGLEHGVDTRMFSRASKTVASVTGVYVPQNKPVVGKNAFVHDAGCLLYTSELEQSYESPVDRGNDGNNQCDSV